MTKFLYDEFSKSYLKELLQPLGEVQTSRKVPAEIREIDVYFTPSSQSPQGTMQLQLLGRLALQPAFIEPFRNAATRSEIRSCMGKLFTLFADIEQESCTRVREGEQEGIQVERQEGIQAERRAIVENLLKVRFGTVDSELSAIIQPIILLSPEEFAPLVLQLSQLSREELLGRFS